MKNIKNKLAGGALITSASVFLIGAGLYSSQIFKKAPAIMEEYSEIQEGLNYINKENSYLENLKENTYFIEDSLFMKYVKPKLKADSLIEETFKSQLSKIKENPEFKQEKSKEAKKIGYSFLAMVLGTLGFFGVNKLYIWRK